MENVRKEIVSRLKQIEVDHQVHIVLAVESGSRAWGFPSQDSDYDVRFLYVHERDWYLELFQQRDVLELPIVDDYDINGWDIKKALVLLRQSNPALLEWLSSPKVYRDNELAMEPLRALAKPSFSSVASCHHYLSMARITMKAYRHKETVKLKKYLYTLRPLLCCRYVVENKQQPPMLFRALLNEYLPNGLVREEVDALLAIKAQGQETDRVKRNARLEQFLQKELERLETLIPKTREKVGTEAYNDGFKRILNAVYCAEYT